MKNLKGGVLAEESVSTGCSMTYHDSNGWHTETGSCDTVTILSTNIGPYPIYITQAFCHTQSFTAPVALSSNGGVNRCAVA